MDLSAPPYLFWLVGSKEKKVPGVTDVQYIVRIYKKFNNNNKYTNVIENEQESLLTFRPTESRVSRQTSKKDGP